MRNLYLIGYSSGAELYQGLTEYFRLYNAECLHQVLVYQTPDEVHASAVGWWSVDHGEIR